MRKLKRRLQESFGKVPDPYYFAGDMEQIRAYYDFRRENDRDSFLLDEITWNDLDMDRVFKRINPRRCTSGEQYLYYMLRSPATDREAYDKRRDFIRFAEADPDRRLKIETILARLGCTRRADVCRAFYPSEHGVGMLVIYLTLFLVLIAMAVCAALRVGFGRRGVLVSLFLNLFVHEILKRGTQSDFDTVNYVVNMVFALHKLRRLHDPELDSLMGDGYKSLDRLRVVIRTGGVSTVTDTGGLYDAIVSVTLLDLITYELLKNKLGRCPEDVFAIHEALGRLDAAVSVASYRKSLGHYSEPEITFANDTAPEIAAIQMIHPLLAEAVPNDLVTDRPILTTGSNASGKSTYLKTAALAAIMAQGICTVLADSYHGSAFQIYSSMALNDDLLAGESYYIVETKSLRRILGIAKTGVPMLCVVDEVLRGTNTVERIAASSEVLRALADTGALCIAATHDIELCELLQDVYRLFHFEEQVGENEMLFDYVIREGKATSRNAIELLRLLGFDKEIVENAHARANRFLESGSWR